MYLSGPMTGLPDFNRDAFRRAKRLLVAAGAAHVWSPATLPGSWGTHESYMLRCLSELSEPMIDPQGVEPWAPRPLYDLLVSLPGWETSGGARLERAVAVACGIEVRDLGEVVA